MDEINTKTFTFLYLNKLAPAGKEQYPGILSGTPNRIATPELGGAATFYWPWSRTFWQAG
jgi:hypothetical protein